MSRLEHDFLGELTIDDSVYYGVQTLRAMNNFHISGTPLSQFPEMIWALACVKKACALANMELQALPRDIGIAICAACDRILAGNMLDQFPVDCIQGGLYLLPSQQPRQLLAVDQRRLSHGLAAGPFPAAGLPCGTYDPLAEGLCGQERGVLPYRQDGTHTAPGCCAHDPGAGIRQLCHDHRGGYPAHP